MLPAFSFASAPFDGLTQAERELLLDSVEPARFAKDTVLLTPGAAVDHAWLLVEGHVQLVEAGEVVALDGPGDLCAARAALSGRASGLLRTLDDVLAWQIPRATLQVLLAGNAGFSTWLFGGISRRLAAAAQRQPRREFVSLMSARVRDAGVRPPFYVDGALDLVSTCRLMAQKGLRHALVRDGQRIGMFTTTDLRDALLLPLPPNQLAVRDVAGFDLIGVTPDAEVFEALLLMIRHRVHRVLVREGDAIVGVLSQLDLMSFVSTHSHLIALQIEQSTSIAELKQAALQIDALVVLLHNDGIRVELICSLVHELNRKLVARLWAMLAPEALVANSCLVVMGSEGRGEQILKTDQDNALLLRDGFAMTGVEQVTDRFTAALIDFGYPRCPGNIMVSNPLWCQPLSGFKETLRHWMFDADPDGLMNLAIFLDAFSIAGDAALLQEARRFIDNGLTGNDVFYARFVSAADQFGEPGGWWARLATLRDRDDRAFDLKKLGTFPVVHGVRTLALQHHVAELGTTARMRALVERGLLPAAMARDLTEALHFLMALKLDNSLRQRRAGQAADNLVRLSALGTLERDLLKDSLAIIRAFRQHLRQLYRLDLL
ncbi:MAG: putative nucleotidyltransferase substrate binding domain-containing protein [Caldimonas sp.]